MSSRVVRLICMVVALLAVALVVAWRMREQPAEVAPLLTREPAASSNSSVKTQDAALVQERTPVQLNSPPSAAAKPLHDDPPPDTTPTLEPMLARQIDTLRDHLEQFRASPSGHAADQLVFSIVMAECEALRRYETYPVGAKIPSSPWDEDYREISTQAMNGGQRVYRFSRYEYPEYWTYVVAPALPQRGDKPKIFAGMKPLEDVQRDTLIQRAEQVLGAVVGPDGK